jgi:hypothetical protein
MFMFLEGDRTYDIIYGLITGGACIALAIPILWWVLPGRERSLFGPRIDPRQRLQLAYGIFCMAMGFTDIGCRTIPHGDLPWVHPTFFLITVILVVGLGPRVFTLGLRGGPSTSSG